MYYYNNAGQQIQAKSFTPLVENYRYRSGEGDGGDDKGGGGGYGFILLIFLVVGLVALLMFLKKK